MNRFLRHSVPMVKGLMASCIVLWAAAAVPAQDQSAVMAPPACQCSVPTPLPALSMTVVNCLCGGVACVVAAPTGSRPVGAPLMQCVK